MRQLGFFDEESLDGFEYDDYELAEPFFEYEAKRVSCSFTGHRNLSKSDKMRIFPSLKSTILYLVSLGVTEFHTGGALGFDTVASLAVLDLMRDNSSIKLILELPYQSQADSWNEADKATYESIKKQATEVNYHSENPKSKEAATKALLKRNRILVDKSHYLVCYKKHEGGGTAYTVKYANLHDLNILEIE